MESNSAQRNYTSGLLVAEEQKLVGTVARVAEFLRYLAEHEDATTISAISRDLGLPPSTVHRILHLLIDQGFVEHDRGSQTYRIGSELYRIGCLISVRGILPQLAQPFMNELVAETKESCLLCMYLPVERAVTVIQAASVPNTLTYPIEKYSTLPIVWGATGRAILAHLADSEIRSIYDAAAPSPTTGAALPRYDRFLAEMRKIKSRGYAKTSGQKVVGAVGLAAAVFGPAGDAVASLCLTIPEFRFNPAREAMLGGLLVEKAAALSHANGYGSAASATAASGRGKGKAMVKQISR